MKMASQLFASELGCTPCECGVPGACTKESLPSFLQWIPANVLFVLLAILLPFIAVLVLALLSRALLKRIWQNGSSVALRTISVLIGALFVPPLAHWITNLNLTESDSSGTSLFVYSFVAILSAYAVLTLIDIRRKRTSVIGSVIGVSIILIVVLLAGLSYKKAVDSKEERLETQIQQIVKSQNESGQSILESSGVTKKANEAEQALKSKNYIDLANQIGTSQKFVLYFRDYDGAHFTKQEFQTVANNSKFKEIEVYHNVADFIVTAGQLFNYITSMLNGNYKTDYYLDNRRVTSEAKNPSEYSEASITYTSGNKWTTLTYAKGADGSWYLSEIGYYDPALQGY